MNKSLLLILAATTALAGPEMLEEMRNSGEEPNCGACKWRKELWSDLPEIQAGNCYMFREKLMGCTQFREMKG